MENVDKPAVVNSSVDEVKNSAVPEETTETCVTAMETDVCHKSNGVVEELHTDDVVDIVVQVEESTTQYIEVLSEEVDDHLKENVSEPECGPAPQAPEDTEQTQTIRVSENVIEDDTTNIPIQGTEPEVNDNTKSNVETIAVIIEDVEKGIDVEEAEVEESVVEIDGIVESTNDRVTFKTEILVEANVNDVHEDNSEELQIVEKDNATNLLNELGQSMELSEMLRSSDTNENVENNNCSLKQEVFNKEELLDILQGNDAEEVVPVALISVVDSKERKPLEKQLAMQQLSRLKRTKKIKPVDLLRKRKNDKKYIVNKKDKEEPKVEESIVTALVKEWEDDEPVQVEVTKKMLEEADSLLKSTTDLVNSQETSIRQDKASVRSSVDSTASDKQTPNLNRSVDESLPQRRLGRVIKKKVIFDPDNPDTFTKGKSIRNKEAQIDKTQSPIKKCKVEHTDQQPKPRTPMSKLQWKKPTPKNSNKYKRLTEVDKLLMDEGAVNMIYQLTPEATKGKKNMKTKAEFIKKLQSSTPDSKEMKFRERKKDSRSEDGEPRKIAGGKQRSSLSTSVKSPSVSEDFEAHSADDSIIYRRHSSSSYSSSCMSPPRLSDVESGVSHNVGRVSHQTSEKTDHKIKEQNTNVSVNDTFMAEQTRTPNKLINKNDCLSIKEKLNSKLSLALNKRKQETTHMDKPAKQKKVSKTIEKQEYKYLSINIENRLGEICIKKPGSNYNIEVIKELESALLYINSKEDVSVTLLLSECGNICTGLDLRPLLIDNLESRTKYAQDTAESIRLLFVTMDQHKKLLCTGVDGSCSGVGLALVALSDVSIASESASFALQSCKSSNELLRNAPLAPGISVLSAAGRTLSKSLLSELVVFGHRVSATDALRHGLVNRTLWPDCFREQLRNIAKDIASQPIQNLLLKKQLLNSTKSEALSSYIEKERDMLVQYWTSPEGLELIRAAYGTT